MARVSITNRLPRRGEHSALPWLKRLEHETDAEYLERLVTALDERLDEMARVMNTNETLLGSGSGDSVQVNAVAVTDANFNDTVPAAVGTGRNVFFQRSGAGPDAVSAYMNLFTAALAGIVPLSGGGVANFLRADGTWAAPPGGAGTFGQAAFDFGTASPTPSALVVSVADAGVGAGSNILLSAQPGAGRDGDEMELGPVMPMLASLTAGVGFDILLLAIDETAHGTYLVNYTRD